MSEQSDRGTTRYDVRDGRRYCFTTPDTELAHALSEIGYRVTVSRT